MLSVRRTSSAFSISLVTTALLLAGQAVPAEAAQTARPTRPKTSTVSERPDTVSAMLSARSQGKRVEDLSQRTETASTFANPDGTWTTEGHAGVQRFRGKGGEWVDVDLNLTEGPDGIVRPGGHPQDLRLPGKGRAPVSVDEGKGRTVSFDFPASSTAPTLKGTTATYADVAPGVDMTIEALRTGFEQSFILKSRPTEAVSWQIPLLTKGLAARPAKDRGIEFVDAKKVVVSRIPAAMAWDARIDEHTGDPVNTAEVDLAVVQKDPGHATLTITPDAEWLADPATEYPVEIDPTYAWANRVTTFDTWVQQGYTSSQSSSTELRLGNDGAGHIARSFLEFQLGMLKGKVIKSATLKLYETHSWSCSARSWEAWKVGSDVDSTTNWSTQPTWDTKYGTSSETKGYSSSCADGWVSIGIGSLGQYWADNTLTTNRLGIRASTESDSYSWKKFSSLETSNDPYITFTYNRIPGTPSTPTLAPAASYNSATYTSDTTPAFSAASSDSDGNTVRYTFQASTSSTFSSIAASCTSAYVASGSTGTCSPTTALADNTTYYVRAQANDSMESSGWSASKSFKTAAATPAAPGISCPAPYSNGTWNDNAPAADLTCTITATGTGTNAPGFIKYSVDGAATKQVQITQSSDPAVAKTTVTVSKADGGHSISAWAISPSGKTSAEAKDAFGYGKTAITTPVAKPMPVTTGNIAILAQGPPAASGTTATSSLKWRLASSNGSESSGWNTAKSLSVATDATTGALKISGTWDTMSATTDAAAGIDLDSRVPATLELQVCTTYSTGDQCTWNSQPLRVLRVPHAFGDGFPVGDAGPGQVALWTGEFTTSATDVEVPGYTGDLSISRTHSTYAGTSNASTNVFGPGWTASIDGPEAGLAGYQLLDNTKIDGTLVLLADDGTPMIFAPHSGWTRRTGADLATGAWDAVDDETADLGINASLSGTSSAATFTIVDPDGVTTKFKVTTAATSTAAAVFAAESVTEPGVGATSFTRDASGRIARVLAPIPTGMTAADCPGTGTLAPGCRALDVTYAATTTATSSTPGDIAGQVQKIDLRIYNPAKTGGAGMDAITVATYSYGSDKRLVGVTDPRSGLATKYAYDASGRLSTLTPAGLTPYTFQYAGDPAKLSRVQRANPSSVGGTATLATVLYGVPTSGSGLPDLSAAGVSDWGQTDAPTYAAAVFGPDKAEATLDPAAVPSADWAYATIYATDERGYTVNTAENGGGEWLPTWTHYNANRYPDLTMDAGDIAAVRAGLLPASQAGTITVYNTASNGPASTPVGSVVTDTYGTSRWVTLKDGSRVLARPHTATTFDEGSPNNGVNPDTGHGWALPTTEASGPVHADDLSDLEAPEVTKTTYGSNTDVAAWKLAQPRSVTEVVDGGTADITTVTDYDSEGRVTAQRQPKSNGSDAGTRKTTYYTVGTNSADAACGNKPQWAGAVCATSYAGQASGQDLVTTRVTGYNAYLAPTTVSEFANGGTRTTITSYDSSSRPTTSTVTASGIAGSQLVNGSETVYSATTGLPIKRWAVNGSGAHVGDAITTDYDSWGRATSYSPNTAESTTTTYDAAGRVTQVVDPKGATSYGYGNDANGNPERRGLPTSQTITGGPGGNSLTFTGAYNANGTLTVQRLPGGITQSLTVDAAGEPVSLTYTGQVTSDNGDGTTTVDTDGGWLGWSVENDVNGRVRREFTPGGAAFTDGGLANGAAAPYDRAYKYDKAGRLTQVDDRTSTVGAGFDPVTGEPAGDVCETRTYAFDKNGNRTGLTRTPGNADGTCQAPGSTGATTKTWSYDTGDRLTGGYVYDAFGRQTTVPATDTPQGTAAGAITLGYYDTDAVASITQNGTTTGFTLDQAGRRSVETTGPTGAAVTSTTTRHYTDETDNPGWVTVATSADTTTTRYGSSLGGDLGVTLATPSAGAVTGELTLADPHGDIVTTVDIPANGPSVGITGWSDSDEYGNALGTATTSTDGVNYGWLGTKERATQATGLMLMGVRVYTPTTGAFTSIDPVFGGNTTSYAYPQDPINGFDLDGRKRCGRWDLKCKAKKAYHSKVGKFVRKHVYESVGSTLTTGAWMGKHAKAAFRMGVSNFRYSHRAILSGIGDDVHSWGGQRRGYQPRHRRMFFYFF